MVQNHLLLGPNRDEIKICTINIDIAIFSSNYFNTYK